MPAPVVFNLFQAATHFAIT